MLNKNILTAQQSKYSKPKHFKTKCFTGPSPEWGSVHFLYLDTGIPRSHRVLGWQWASTAFSSVSVLLPTLGQICSCWLPLREDNGTGGRGRVVKRRQRKSRLDQPDQAYTVVYLPRFPGVLFLAWSNTEPRRFLLLFLILWYHQGRHPDHLKPNGHIPFPKEEKKTGPHISRSWSFLKYIFLVLQKKV